MKIRTKLVLGSLSCLSICMAIGQYAQYSSTLSLLQQFGEKNQQTLKEQETRSLKAMQLALSTSLEEGEMDAFFATLRGLKQVDGLLEASLFDGEKGVVKASSHDTALNRALPENVKTAFFNKPEQIITWNNDSVEIFTPHLVEKKCLKCHDDWKAGQLGGTSYFKFSNRAAKKADEDSRNVLQDMTSTAKRQAVLSVVGITVALSILLYLLATRIVSQPLTRLCKMLGLISLGDLSQRFEVNSDDEIGEMTQALDGVMTSLKKKVDLAIEIAHKDISNEVPLASELDVLGKALQQMTASLNKLLSEVNEAATTVHNGANQISTASNSLSDGATEQAGALREIATSITEISSEVRKNADCASEAKQSSVAVEQVVTKGLASIEDMTSSMDDISAASKEIVNVVKVIDDIAFQTNLLALNAAVEAARAGRHGKGFSVVAEEVRNLASRSAKAAKETADRIAGSLDKVERGRKSAQNTATTLTEIAEQVATMRKLINEISDQSSAQSAAIAEVSQGLEQIGDVTERSAASSEETASAASELVSRARELASMLNEFRLNPKLADVTVAPSGLSEEAHELQL